jgi:hypothetical protein
MDCVEWDTQSPKCQSEVSVRCLGRCTYWSWGYDLTAELKNKGKSKSKDKNKGKGKNKFY